MNQTKYLEYYMDSKIYSKDEVQKSIDETRKEFPKKEIEVQVQLNKFGVYIITFIFKNRNSSRVASSSPQKVEEAKLKVFFRVLIQLLYGDCIVM